MGRLGGKPMNLYNEWPLEMWMQENRPQFDEGQSREMNFSGIFEDNTDDG
jgi:hypothetical protein